MHKRTPTRRSRSCAPCVVRVQDISCTWQVHDKYLLKGGRGGLIHVVATTGLSSHHPFLKPFVVESEDAPPGGWVYYMTSCFLSLAARCSQRPPPQSGVNSQSVPAATMICHFPPPQRLEIVLCPMASPLTQTHAPRWTPAPLFGMDSNKKALFFPKDKNAENLPSSLSVCLHPRKSWLSTWDRAGMGPALCSAGYPAARPPSPHFTDEDTEVQRKERFAFRGLGVWRGVPAASPGAHKVQTNQVLSPLSCYFHPSGATPLIPLLF